ncbi:LysE family transporter [Shewanella sp. FJAT-52076]|nr:LysE family transporter [Shewanella sp. FJAT-52076]QYJ77206.1 LysE family transporter [Shewanella sp. FJAT-52076]
MDFTLLGSIAVIHAIALASPGPDFAIMLKVSRYQTRAVAMMTALGIAAAILAHTLASLTGLSLLIHTTPWLFGAVQALGAAYLGYMGLGALISVRKQFLLRRELPLSSQSTPTDAPPNPDSMLSTAKGFRLGLYTNLLNPKALVFFLTLFSAMVGPEVNSATRMALLVLMFALSFAWFGLLAVLLTKNSSQRALVRLGPIIDLVTGVLFLMVSVAILFGLATEYVG